MAKGCIGESKHAEVQIYDIGGMIMKQEFAKAYDRVLQENYGETVCMSEFVAIHGLNKVLTD